MLLMKKLAPWLYFLKNNIVINDIHFKLPLDGAPRKSMFCALHHISNEEQISISQKYNPFTEIAHNETKRRIRFYLFD